MTRTCLPHLMTSYTTLYSTPIGHNILLIQSLNLNLKIGDKQLNREYSILKYLGIIIDSNLNWKKQVEGVAKNIRRGVGILSKVRHYVRQETLRSLDYALIYPFLSMD